MAIGAIKLFIVAVAAIAGGLVNALAGGGTLITFPVLTAVGVPAVVANITNTVALSPGYMGASFAQIRDLKDQKRRIRLLLPTGVLGGVLGGILLLNTGEHAFREIVPYLILFAVVLLAFQGQLRALLARQAGHKKMHASEAWSVLPVLPAAVYGGYFGAGVSVIILAVLGLALNDSLTRLNALKQSISFSINIAAAVFFVFSGKVLWPAALVMAAGAIIGGIIGGRIAGRIHPAVLKWTVVTIGTAVAVYFFVS